MRICWYWFKFFFTLFFFHMFSLKIIKAKQNTFVIFVYFFSLLLSPCPLLLFLYFILCLSGLSLVELIKVRTKMQNRWWYIKTTRNCEPKHIRRKCQSTSNDAWRKYSLPNTNIHWHFSSTFTSTSYFISFAFNTQFFQLNNHKNLIFTRSFTRKYFFYFFFFCINLLSGTLVPLFFDPLERKKEVIVCSAFFVFFHSFSTFTIFACCMILAVRFFIQSLMLLAFIRQK